MFVQIKERFVIVRRKIVAEKNFSDFLTPGFGRPISWMQRY